MPFTTFWDHRSARLGLLALLLLAAAAWALQRQAPLPAAAARMPQAQGVQGAPVHAADLQRVAQGDVPNPADAKAGHAASLVEMGPESPALLSLFWFSGERESGPQVQIAAAQWLRATQTWTAPHMVVNRHQLGAMLGYGVRRLGNPVAWRDGHNRLHLYVVATGWGGWAASRVLHLRQKGEAQDLAHLELEPVRTLPLSWLWNTSFLVRNAPLALADGGVALPVHFELGAKIPAWVRLDAEGEFSGWTRISQRDHVLQPSLLPLGPQHWLALMRDEGPTRRIAVAQTLDGGRSWTDAPELALPNPDAAVASLALAPGELLLAYNPITTGRERLDLARSANGVDWLAQAVVRQGEGEDEYSYPAMLWAGGSLWLAYTVDRARLAWQRYVPKEQP